MYYQFPAIGDTEPIYHVPSTHKAPTSTQSKKWIHKGYVLDTHKQYIQFRFRLCLFFIFTFELFAIAWPITAAIIYKTESVMTWFWFLYVIRVLILLYPFLLFENVLILYGTGNYKNFINWARIPAAFVPSKALFAWTWCALLIGGLVGSMITIATIASKPFVHSNLLYGLSVGFSALFVFESIGAVFILYWKGIWSPVMTAKQNLIREGQIPY